MKILVRIEQEYGGASALPFVDLVEADRASDAILDVLSNLVLVGVEGKITWEQVQ